MEPYWIDASDRAAFKQCRRAWDLGARARRNLAAVNAPPRDPVDVASDAFREALAVYYFPGMWDWNRSIVVPLVHQALDRGGGEGGGAGGGVASSASGSAPAPASAHELVDAYAAWAPSLDRFVPIRVAADIEVNVPDPLLGDRDITTDSGQPVRYAARADAVVWSEEDGLELMCHRIGTGPFPDVELLGLDEAALTTCWAWSHLMLDDRIGAILFNEIRLDGRVPFRRTRLPVSRDEVALAGRQLGVEVFDMLDAGLSVYPNPTLAGCALCTFRRPCRAMREGSDAGAVLAASFGPRVAPELKEGRLGGRTWSMNRGARPPWFGP